MIGEPLAVFLVIAFVVLASVWLEERTRAVRAAGSVLTAIVLAALLSNLGVLPARSAAYDVLGGVVVNLGIALILLGVDVQSVIRAGPRMLAAFSLGTAGTVLGAIVGAMLLGGAIGPETWKLAGQYTGTYIGGGVNMVAVGRGLETSPDLFSAAVAADNVTTALWMAVCLVLPGLLGRWWRAVDSRGGTLDDGRPPTVDGRSSSVSGGTAVQHEFTATARGVTLLDTAALAVIAFGAVWTSERLAALLPLPAVLWLTTIALGLAQTGPVRRLAGGPMLGNYALHLFLAALGAQSLVGEILRVGPAVFWFTVVVVGVHGLVLFGGGRALRLDLPTLAVASQANVGGPASAMAVATARGYSDRVLPGVAVGLLGYAVGNYLGFVVAGLLRGWI